jgi:hypothetical protein
MGLAPALLRLLPACVAAVPAVGAPPPALRAELGLSPWYRKAIVTGGLAIVASEKSSDYALREAAFVVDAMLAGRDDVRAALVKRRVRVAVMAPTEMTCDVPEHSDLEPPAYWNKRARGLGATRRRPAISAAEENLLNYDGDPYRGESILVHEFGHTIHEMGMAEVDPTFDGRLRRAYDEAMSRGLWRGTYAATNHKEYWAEGVQDWFDCNLTDRPQHNQVGTRAALHEYDPGLAALMAEVFGDRGWRYVPPVSRPQPAHLQGLDRAAAPRFVWPAQVLEAFARYQQSRGPSRER